MPPPSGIVGWWPGEGNANDIVGPNNGVPSGGVTWVTGHIGQAIHFNGIDGIVTAPTVGLPVGGSDRTLEMWARVDAFDPNNSFFAGYGTFGIDGTIYAVGAVTTSGTAYFSQWGLTLVGPPLPSQTWVHLAVTSQNGFTIVYVNGALAAAGSLTLNTAAGTTLDLGRVAGILGDSRRLNGALDEVSIYNRALSATEIASIAAAPLGKCH